RHVSVAKKVQAEESPTKDRPQTQKGKEVTSKQKGKDAVVGPKSAKDSTLVIEVVPETPQKNEASGRKGKTDKTATPSKSTPDRKPTDSAKPDSKSKQQQLGQIDIPAATKSLPPGISTVAGLGAESPASPQAPVLTGAW